MGLMPGPSPTYCPCFPLAFLAQARQRVRQRTRKLQLRPRAVLVLLLHAQPLLSKVAAGRWAQLHPDSVRPWRRRWVQGAFSLEDEPGRGRKAVFSPSGACRRQSPRVRVGLPNPPTLEPPVAGGPHRARPPGLGETPKPEYERAHLGGRCDSTLAVPVLEF